MDIKKSDDAIILYPPSNLDIDTSEKLKKALAKGIKNNPTKNVILNFNEVEYVNSTSLSVVINTQNELRESDKKLLLCNINKKVLGLIKIVNLYDVFEVIDTEEEAILSLKKPVGVEQ